MKLKTMQRVRIGLTGLGLVFLLVLIGAVIRSVSTDEAGPGNVAGLSSVVDATSNDLEPTEPLAQLGVAPGSTESENGAGSNAGEAKK